MNHASGLLFLSLFLLFFFRTIRPLRARQSSSSVADPLLSGLCLAIALNIRPLSALAVSVPIAGYGVYLLVKSRWRTLPAFLVLLVPVLLGLGASGLYNYLTTGSPLLSGYDVQGMLEYGQRAGVLGFGDRGFPEWGAHTPLRGLVQTGNNLNALNLYLFQSPVPGLVLILLLLLTFTRNSADRVVWCEFCEQINAWMGCPRGSAVRADEMLEHSASVKGMVWLVNRSWDGDGDPPALDMRSLVETYTAIVDMPDVEEDDGSDPLEG